jgi:hypothetical protein
MPSSDSSRLTQRRRHVAVGLVLVLAVAWVLFSVFAAPKAPLPTRWVGFEPSADGTSVVGVITLTNHSGKTFSLELSGTGKVSTAHFFGLSWPTNMDVWRPDVPPPHRRFVDLPPGAGERITVALPQDGRTGRVAIWVGTRPRLRNKLETWVRSLSPGPRKIVEPQHFQLLEESIQCPLTRPDGTVEPGRVVGR